MKAFFFFFSLTLFPMLLNGQQKIAYLSNQSGNFDIWTMSPDGSNQVNLTNDAAVDGGPSWAPTAQQLAFYSDKDGDFEIYVMKADGTGRTQITTNITADQHPFWR